MRHDLSRANRDLRLFPQGRVSAARLEGIPFEQGVRRLLPGPVSTPEETGAWQCP